MNVIATAASRRAAAANPRCSATSAASSSRATTASALCRATGIDAEFVQDNHSRSAQDVLRGLHYQISQPQGKLVRVVGGRGVRRGGGPAPQFATLRHSGASHASVGRERTRMAWIPPGFAHGFLVLSEYAEFLYKTTDYYAPEHERSLHWNDPALDIDWPLDGEPLLSAKDQAARAARRVRGVSHEDPADRRQRPGGLGTAAHAGAAGGGDRRRPQPPRSRRHGAASAAAWTPSRRT